MNLLKYTNSTNPTAPNHGVAVITDEELATFNVNIEIVKNNLSQGKTFRFHVGDQGGIYHYTVEDLDYEILTVDSYEHGDTGFTRWFADGVITLAEDSFIEPIIINPEDVL